MSRRRRLLGGKKHTVVVFFFCQALFVVVVVSKHAKREFALMRPHKNLNTYDEIPACDLTTEVHVLRLQASLCKLHFEIDKPINL